MNPDEVFDLCIKKVNSMADLHFAYGDRTGTLQREISPDADKWIWSGEFLREAARLLSELKEKSQDEESLLKTVTEERDVSWKRTIQAEGELAELKRRLYQRECDLDSLQCRANTKIAELEHQIRVIQMNSADNYAAAENRTHKVEAERDELAEKVTALIAQLAPLMIPEAR
jgi:hypothetical protein